MTHEMPYSDSLCVSGVLIKELFVTFSQAYGEMFPGWDAEGSGSRAQCRRSAAPSPALRNMH